MKICPNCSEPLGFLTIACHQDVVVCRGCKSELTPDKRSIAWLYVALAAYIPVLVLVARHIRGLTMGWAMLVGFGAGLAGALVATSVFFFCVRLRVNRGARHTASAHS